MKKIFFIIFTSIILLWQGAVFAQTPGRFDTDLTQTLTPLLGKALDTWVPQKWVAWVQTLILNVTFKIIVPLAIIYGILMAILGFYKLMNSEEDGQVKKATNYIIRWIIGTVVMFSANYLGNAVFKDLLSQGLISNFIGTLSAEKVYTVIAYPFIKLAIYLVIWILFIVLLIHAFRFLFNPDDKIKTHAKNIIIYNVIGMILIIFANQIVSVIYGSRNLVARKVASLSDIGTSLFAARDFSIAYEVINWVMGIITLVILVLVIFQGYQLLMNPTDEKILSSIKKNFLYIFIGILIIGAGYLITNFVIITP